MTMAEVFVRKPGLFGAEQQGHSLRRQARADVASAYFETMKFVVPFAIARGCGSDNERAIRNCICDVLVLVGMFEHRRGANGRTGFTKRQLVRIDHPQAQKTEVTHGASSRPKIKRIARGDQDHAKIAGFQDDIHHRDTEIQTKAIQINDSIAVNPAYDSLVARSKS